MNNGLQPHWCLGSVVEEPQRDQSYGCMFGILGEQQANNGWMTEDSIYR